MPQRKPVETLKQLCFQVITKNFHMYPLEGIYCLPTTLLEELNHFPNDSHQKFVSENKVQMITENMTRLSLSLRRWDRVDIIYALDPIPNQFKNMKRFVCEDGKKKGCALTQQQILSFVLSFPNIIDMTLDCSEVNDDLLKAIGDNCPNLEYLTLNLRHVTDVGISHLCQSKSRGSNIKYLDLKFNRLTMNGCLMGLQNLKQLRVFKERELENAFKKLFQDLNGSQELPTFELCELPGIEMENIPLGFLNFLTKCCPNASNLTLYVSHDLSNDVIEIKKCDKTLPLTIYVSGEDFSMSPLTDVGSNVTSLNIQGSDVDLELIGNFFPNLKVLQLSNNVNYQPIVNFISKKYVTPLWKLQKLIIVDSIIDVLQLKFLLQNCLELQELIMYDIDINADTFISLIHRVNPLRHLTRFEIDALLNTSKIVVLELLKMENNLQLVKIQFKPLSWSKDDKSEIERYVKKNNLCTCIHFSEKNWI